MTRITASTALGRAVKALRIEKGVSQEALADKAGIQRPTLSAIERGTSDPRLSTLLKLADALNESGVTLIGRTESILGKPVRDDN